jgi:hypothetical protein
MQFIISKIDIGELCHGEHYFVKAEQPNGVVVIDDGKKLRYLNSSQYTTEDEQRKKNNDEKIKLLLEDAAKAKVAQAAS